MKTDSTKGYTQEELKLREETVQTLFDSLSKKHPHVTKESCYQIYDKMIAENKKGNGRGKY